MVVVGADVSDRTDVVAVVLGGGVALVVVVVVVDGGGGPALVARTWLGEYGGWWVPPKVHASTLPGCGSKLRVPWSL